MEGKYGSGFEDVRYGVQDPLYVGSGCDVTVSKSIE